jgi:hypothetical protein
MMLYGIFVFRVYVNLPEGNHRFHLLQWPFQDPRLEVPTIYKAYCSGLCKGIFPLITGGSHFLLTSEFYLYQRLHQRFLSVASAHGPGAGWLSTGNVE